MKYQDKIINYSENIFKMFKNNILKGNFWEKNAYIFIFSTKKEFILSFFFFLILFQ